MRDLPAAFGIFIRGKEDFHARIFPEVPAVELPIHTFQFSRFFAVEGKIEILFVPECPDGGADRQRHILFRGDERDGPGRFPGGIVQCAVDGGRGCGLRHIRAPVGNSFRLIGEIVRGLKDRLPHLPAQGFDPGKIFRGFRREFLRLIEKIRQTLPLGGRVNCAPHFQIRGIFRNGPDRRVYGVSGDLHPVALDGIEEFPHLRGGRSVHEPVMLFQQRVHIGLRIPQDLSIDVKIQVVEEKEVRAGFEVASEDVRTDPFQE